MQKQQLSKATRTVYTILRQIATLIPREFVKDAAEAKGSSSVHSPHGAICSRLSSCSSRGRSRRTEYATLQRRLRTSGTGPGSSCRTATRCRTRTPTVERAAVDDVFLDPPRNASTDHENQAVMFFEIVVPSDLERRRKSVVEIAKPGNLVKEHHRLLRVRDLVGKSDERIEPVGRWRRLRPCLGDKLLRKGLQLGIVVPPLFWTLPLNLDKPSLSPSGKFRYQRALADASPSRPPWHQRRICRRLRPCTRSSRSRCGKPQCLWSASGTQPRTWPWRSPSRLSFPNPSSR